jgi:hypothetical protein
VKLGVVESTRAPFLLLCILSLFGAAARSTPTIAREGFLSPISNFYEP